MRKPGTKKRQKTKGQVKKERQSRRPKFRDGIELCSSVFFCDEHGEYVNLKVICNPKYIPHLRFKVKNKDNGRVLQFMLHAHGKLWRLEPGTLPCGLFKVKHNKKKYKELIAEVLDKVPTVWTKEHEYNAKIKKKTVKPMGSATVIGGTVSGTHPNANSRVYTRLNKLINKPVNLGISHRGIK